MGRFILLLLFIALVVFVGILIYEHYLTSHKDSHQLKYRIKHQTSGNGKYVIQFQMPVTKRWKNNTRIVTDNMVIDDEYDNFADAELSINRMKNDGIKVGYKNII